MGGAAGHMNHPFDLGSVRTGKDLIDFFYSAVDYLETEGAGSVKIDGVNVSFKLVEQDGQHQFAVDRGSMKEIDISGITMNRVDQRFPEGHGMRPAIKTLLTILNEALPSIEPQLKELGMWDNPTLFLNTEYVEGTTNVTDYDENFLAIHGLNQFYEKTAKSGASKGNIRPGAERPTTTVVKRGQEVEVPIKDPSREVSYNPEVMVTLIKKLNPIAEKLGFKVYGDVPTSRIVDSNIDLEKTLSEPFTIKISDDREVTKPLGDWLKGAKNPDYDALRVKININGQEQTVTRHALNAELYKIIGIDKNPIVNIVDQADAERTIDGTVFMHATRMLGNDVLRGLTSPMGDIMNHEGVVLRDEEKFGPKPVKITGEFILGNLGSGFGNVKENEEDFVGYPHKPVEEQEDESADPVVDADFTGETVAFVPGAYKPPHLGHLKMVEQYANRDDVDRVIILISSPKKKNRTLEDGTVIKATHAEDVWKLLLTSAGLSNNSKVDLRVSSEPSPIGATLDMIGPNGILKPGDKVILGASDKPDDSGVPDWHRWLFVKPKDMMQGVELLDRQENAVKAFDRQGGTPFRARDMRSLISKAKTDVDAIEELEEFVGEENVFELLAIFGMGPRQEEVDAELEEGAAVTNVGSIGYGAPPISSQSKIKKFNKKEKEISKLKRENIDLNMVDEVMKLIIDKGILR